MNKYTLPVVALVAAGTIGGGTYLYASQDTQPVHVSAQETRMTMETSPVDIPFIGGDMSFDERKKAMLKDMALQITDMKEYLSELEKTKDALERATTDKELNTAFFGSEEIEIDGEYALPENLLPPISFYDSLDDTVKKIIPEDKWNQMTLREIDEALAKAGATKLFEDPYYDKTVKEMEEEFLIPLDDDTVIDAVTQEHIGQAR